MHIARSRLAALVIGAAIAASAAVAGPAAAHDGHDHGDPVSATTWANYERVRLAGTAGVGEPIDLAVLPDSRVLHTTRGGSSIRPEIGSGRSEMVQISNEWYTSAIVTGAGSGTLRK